MFINLPPGGYDSDSSGAHVPVTLLCTSAACLNGVVDNGFLLSAYDSDGNAVGTFVNWPAGALRGAIGAAAARSQGFLRGAALQALTRAPRAAQASGARAATR